MGEINLTNGVGSFDRQDLFDIAEFTRSDEIFDAMNFFGLSVPQMAFVLQVIVDAVSKGLEEMEENDDE